MQTATSPVSAPASGPASGPASFRTPPTPPLRCRRKFLRFFPDGFHDARYVAWERRSCWSAHAQWQELLPAFTLRSLLKAESHAEIVERALRIESRTNLLLPHEKLALHHALKTEAAARSFARGLHVFLHGYGSEDQLFERWCAVIGSLPVAETRIFSWPIVTVFGFIAQPDRHIFLKPSVTKRGAAAYGFDLRYEARPSHEPYASLLELASVLKRDLRDLEPRDMIDLQSFLRVQGSDEY